MVPTCGCVSAPASRELRISGAPAKAMRACTESAGLLTAGQVTPGLSLGTTYGVLLQKTNAPTAVVIEELLDLIKQQCNCTVPLAKRILCFSCCVVHRRHPSLRTTPPANLLRLRRAAPFSVCVLRSWNYPSDRARSQSHLCKDILIAATLFSFPGSGYF